MKQSVIKKIALALMIAVGVLLCLFLAREVAIRFFGYTPPAISESQQKKVKEVEVSLDPSAQYQHIVTNNYIYFVSTDKIIIASGSGKQEEELDIITSNPVVKHSGKYVLVGDVGGKNVYLINGTSIKKTIVTKGALVDLYVNASGYTILVTEGDMHKRDVTVYNTKGEEQFVWNSGNALVLGAAIADNNKNIVISTLDTSDGTMKSVLSFYNISNEAPIKTEECKDELYAAIEICGSHVYCVGDSKTSVYRLSGSKTADIPYNGKTLITYKTNKSHIVMAFSESALDGKRYDIASYTVSGKKAGSYELDYQIEYFDFVEDTIAISRGRLIDIVTLTGREKKLLDPGVDIQNIRFLNGATSAVGFTARGAYIFSIS